MVTQKVDKETWPVDGLEALVHCPAFGRVIG
jgi:hypothetical protein